jgi:hypothetical protein
MVLATVPVVAGTWYVGPLHIVGSRMAFSQLLSAWRAHGAWCRYQFGLTYVATSKTATLYLNGQPVSASTNFNLTLAGVGDITQPWLGLAQWQDPYTDGRFKQFRFYTGALRSVR